jgi:hypothetical protein
VQRLRPARTALPFASLFFAVAACGSAPPPATTVAPSPSASVAAAARLAPRAHYRDPADAFEIDFPAKPELETVEAPLDPAAHDRGHMRRSTASAVAEKSVWLASRIDLDDIPTTDCPSIAEGLAQNFVLSTQCQRDGDLRDATLAERPARELAFHCPASATHGRLRVACVSVADHALTAVMLVAAMPDAAFRADDVAGFFGSVRFFPRAAGEVDATPVGPRF